MNLQLAWRPHPRRPDERRAEFKSFQLRASCLDKGFLWTVSQTIPDDEAPWDPEVVRGCNEAPTLLAAKLAAGASLRDWLGSQPDAGPTLDDHRSQRCSKGRITKWSVEKQPNGLFRCEAHFSEPVRSWDGLYAARWTWAQDGPEKAASNMVPWLRHQRVEIPLDLMILADGVSDPW